MKTNWGDLVVGIAILLVAGGIFAECVGNAIHTAKGGEEKDGVRLEATGHIEVSDGGK